MGKTKDNSIIIALTVIGVLTLAGMVLAGGLARPGYYTITLPDGSQRFLTSLTSSGTTTMHIQGFLVCDQTGTCASVTEDGYLRSYVAGTISKVASVTTGTSGSLVVHSLPHQYLHGGHGWVASGIMPYNQTTTTYRNIHTSTTNTSPHIRMQMGLRSTNSTTATCIVQLYRDSTTSVLGASAVTVYNRAGYSVLTSGMTVSANGFRAPAGTVVDTWMMSTYEGINFNLEHDEHMLKTASSHVISSFCTNSGNVVWRMTWYE